MKVQMIGTSKIFKMLNFGMKDFEFHYPKLTVNLETESYKGGLTSKAQV